MCTAVTFHTNDHYFGRNLDLDRSFGEAVTVTPRNYPFAFRHQKSMEHHYGLIGMAVTVDNYPLYFDATNEKGLSMAGLNFPALAVYQPYQEGFDNITPFELIPWILGQCESVEDAEVLLRRINLLRENFSEAFPLSPLHWIIADRERSITVEPLPEGLKIYENPVGVLTNNPTFDYHMYHLADFMNLTPEPPVNRFSQKIALQPYSLGMGSMGLPGDPSSTSRFVKAVFTKLNSRCENSESASVSQFFHILGSVAQQDGCTGTEHGFEKTVYSSCCNVDTGTYYYTTYENSQITGVNLFREDLEGCEVIVFPLVSSQQVRMEN